MANRSIVYDEQQLDPFDVLWQFKDFLASIGSIELDLTGQTTTLVTGFTPTPTGPASLSINLTAGRIYQQSVMDSTAYGALASDSTIVQQQGNAPAQSVTLSTAGLSAGQSMWALVQAQFSQQDIIRASDPTGGVLNYFNTNNPNQPFQGPNNDGASQPTERQATVSIQVIFGTPASTGSEVPPNPTSGWVPLFLVDLTFAQTAITSGQILVAGPSVGANVPNNYPGAPFLAGLLNKHHTGKAGAAPQIDLTSEVKNLLPLANLPASGTTGGLGALRIGSGNPNGSQAGNFNVNGALDVYWDQVGSVLYVCTVTGNAASAVWTSVTNATTSIFSGGTATGTVNAQVVGSTTPSGFTKAAGQVVTFTGLNNTGSATLNIDGTGASTVQKNTGGGNVNLTGGELNGFVTVVWTGSIYLLQPGLLGQLSTLNIGQWLKNDGAGNLTINVDGSLQDNGSGKLQVNPGLEVPIGGIVQYAGSSAPFTNWAICNGQAVSRTTFASCFAALGITYGSGDGITTFNLPDTRGRVKAGVDGGANRLTTTTMTSQALGGTGGGETETLTLAQIPAGITSNGSVSASSAGSFLGGTSIAGALPGSGGSGVGVQASGAVLQVVNSSGSASVTSNNTSGQPHPNVQATIELNDIIRLA